MASSTKPEVHNILHCCQRRTQLRRHTCTENSVKGGRAVFEICEQTGKQTHRHDDHSTLHSCRGEVKKFEWVVCSHWPIKEVLYNRSMPSKHTQAHAHTHTHIRAYNLVVERSEASSLLISSSLSLYVCKHLLLTLLTLCDYRSACLLWRGRHAGSKGMSG